MRSRTYSSRKMKSYNKRTGRYILFSAFLMFVIVIGILAFSIPSNINQTGSHSRTISGDVFNGEIVNNVLVGGLGIVQADLDCKGHVESITCRAVIMMDSGETIHFKYTHNMVEEPCLSPGDRVKVELLSNLKAVVYRF
ncbi:MAG: hypothetical protein QW724_06755 [Nitrososphaerota archaeon]